jgi:hypothetical protein
MPTVHIDNVGEMAIIECAGRFVRSEAALKLRDAVRSQTDVRVVVLDLTEMHAIGGGGLAGPSHQYEENSKNSSRGARRREAGQTQVLEPRAKAPCGGEGTNLWQSSR